MEVYLPNTHPKLGSFRVKRECCVDRQHCLSANITKKNMGICCNCGQYSTYVYYGSSKRGQIKEREVCPFQKAITRMMIRLKQTNNFRTRRVDGSDVDIISNKLTLLYCPYSSATALISAFFATLMYFNQELIIFKWKFTPSMASKTKIRQKSANLKF